MQAARRPVKLPAMNVPSTQNAPVVGDVKTAAVLTAVKSAKAQMASVLQLFDPAKSVPPPRKSEESAPPPPPKESGRGHVVDRQA